VCSTVGSLTQHSLACSSPFWVAYVRLTLPPSLFPYARELYPSCIFPTHFVVRPVFPGTCVRVFPLFSFVPTRHAAPSFFRSWLFKVTSYAERPSRPSSFARHDSFFFLLFHPFCYSFSHTIPLRSPVFFPFFASNCVSGRIFLTRFLGPPPHLDEVAPFLCAALDVFLLPPSCPPARSDDVITASRTESVRITPLLPPLVLTRWLRPLFFLTPHPSIVLRSVICLASLFFLCCARVRPTSMRERVAPAPMTSLGRGCLSFFSVCIPGGCVFHVA